MKKIFAALAIAATLTACSGQAPHASPALAPVALTASVVTADASATLTHPRVAVETSAAPVVAPVAPRKVTAPVVAVPVPKVTKVKPAAPVAVSPKVDTPVAPEPRCEEDMPCWDCETMGNGSCGPMVPVDDYVLIPEECAVEALDYVDGKCVYFE